MKTLKSNLLSTFFVSALLFFSNSLVASTVTLTQAQWIIAGNDAGGGIWDGSILVFESQVQNGSDYELSGYFEWIGSGNQTGSYGRENFTGTLFSDNQIELIGFEIVPPSYNVVYGGYSGILSAAGHEITNGYWGSLADGPSGIPGSWSAVQAVPVPAAVWLFGSGLIGFIGIARRKKAA